MKIQVYLIILTSAVIMLQCSLSDSESPGQTLYSTSVFESDPDGWEAGFADFTLYNEDTIRAGYEHTSFTTAGGYQTVTAVKQSGYAVDGDLFIFIKNKIGGLEPNSNYKIGFNLEFYVQLNEDYPENIFDEQHGSFLKAGAFENEPRVDTVVNFENSGLSRVLTDFDKGDNHTVGDQMIYLGKVTHTRQDEAPVVMNGSSLTQPISAKSDDEGFVWVLVGLDANLPIYQSIYYSYIMIQFQLETQ